MKLYKFNKTAINLALSITAIIITLFVVISSPSIQEGYDLKVGSLSPKRFVAPRDIRDDYETQKLIDEAINSVAPLYKQDFVIEDSVLQEINDYLIQEKKAIDRLKELEAEAGKDTEEEAQNTEGQVQDTEEEAQNTEGQVQDTEEQTQNTGGQAQDTVQNAEESPEQKPKSKIESAITPVQYERLKNKTDSEYEQFSELVLEVTKRFFDKKIAYDSNIPAKSAFTSFIAEEMKASEIAEEDWDLLNGIVSNVITYSFIMDNDATLMAKNEAASKVEPVMILKGQKIIDADEIISERVYSVLDALNYVNQTDFKTNMLPVIGVLITIITLFISVLLYLYTFYKKIFIQTNQTMLLYTLYIILIVVTRLMVDVPYMFIPILTFTTLIAMLISYRAAIILNLAVSFLCLIIYKGDLQFFTYFALTGMFTPLVTGYTKERNQIIIAGIINAVISAVMIMGTTLFFEKSVETVLLNNILYAFLSGLLTLILAIGTLPFWEAVFGIITEIKLLELVNPSRKLIRRLMIEAPGTYHHSLIVSNLAEAAACEIGANAALARAGGYFHDIGKLKYPQYFAENVMSENIHDKMNPYSSIDVIISHVSAGVEMADAYKLPKVVRDIIYEHHGNSLMKFFYLKAKEVYADKEINKDDFRYPNVIPQSKESAIVMLSDTVEAAVRSVVSTKTFGDIEVFIKQLIKDKLDDGQLTDSGLSLKEVEIISKSFMGVFKGMYHERVPYPEDKKEPSE